MINSLVSAGVILTYSFIVEHKANNFCIQNKLITQHPRNGKKMAGVLNDCVHLHENKYTYIKQTGRHMHLCNEKLVAVSLHVNKVFTDSNHIFNRAQ